VEYFLDIKHKKNVKYFFDNAKKAKEKAKTNVPTGKKVGIIVNTVAHDVLTSGEFCGWKRRVAHLLGMYGTIIFWVTSAIMVFKYATPVSETPVIISQFMAFRCCDDLSRRLLVLVLFKS
jgi:hypothetical protein